VRLRVYFGLATYSNFQNCSRFHVSTALEKNRVCARKNRVCARRSIPVLSSPCPDHTIQVTLWGPGRVRRRFSVTLHRCPPPPLSFRDTTVACRRVFCPPPSRCRFTILRSPTVESFACRRAAVIPDPVGQMYRHIRREIKELRIIGLGRGFKSKEVVKWMCCSQVLFHSARIHS
jgi:hypothetical protein